METLYLKNNSRKIQKELVETKLLMNLLCVLEMSFSNTQKSSKHLTINIPPPRHYHQHFNYPSIQTLLNPVIHLIF